VARAARVRIIDAVSRALLQPGRLLGIRMVKMLEQLPRLGFELADEDEVAFCMPVCHDVSPIGA
jgi:hypothetical protein